MADLGGVLPWGVTLGNYPGDRSKYYGAWKTLRDAAARSYPGYNWQNYQLGRVTSPLDAVRVVKKSNVVEDPDQGTPAAISVAGI